MAINTLTAEAYYEDTDYLSNSALHNFVSFDIFGVPTYNIHEFLNPSRKDSDAILTGSLVDKVLTEDFDLDEHYGPQLKVDALKAELDRRGIKYKSSETKPNLMAQLQETDYVFKEELSETVRKNVENVVQTAHKFRYDLNTSFMQFVAESDCQCIIVNDEWGMKGKFDFLNTTRGIIADLKTTGQLDKLLKELIYKGSINPFHKYVRQLAIYQHLYFLETGKKFICELHIIDYKGHHTVIRIGQRALDKALAQVMIDIEMLNKMYLGEVPAITTYDLPEDTNEVEIINPAALDLDEIDEEVEATDQPALNTFE